MGNELAWQMPPPTNSPSHKKGGLGSAFDMIQKNCIDQKLSSDSSQNEPEEPEIYQKEP
jgi:hypothetical protein